ncbi:S-methyl-5'-thioinosine phosphorylase [Pseudohalioglobus sediminis]|uniref:Probable 6-oxopurine nucleoside phosphorylase n=1 Tax=Pseudohalioglobus sediminis TaxID=2606449 RepID=A0A5B0WME3_9GAMM|nr:S-methyl-5'-thioinosine phosphorylase [Pseudohalioglobus sediminis]KAA1188240.1 S-methyl-5'-thioinosine phosphorylase [Pseudohalioglobus sediminis]
MSILGVIGGTGLDQLSGLQIVDTHALETPYGEPSRPLQEGQLGGRRLFFLQRHGSPRAIPPHRVNYRANLWALQHLGVTDVVAINAVGGISEGMRPGRLVIPDQIIDYTWGREHTFDTGEDDTLMHIDFTSPYDARLRQALLDAAGRESIAHAGAGVHGVMQGPRLETAAEIQRMARDGCDLVGMTGMPEASLARELGLAYASVCMVVNAAAGLDDKPLTLEMMRDTLHREAAVVGRLLVALAADAHYAR